MSPFTATAADSLAALGEVRLISRIRSWLGTASPRTPAGIGDDCAILDGSPHQQLITVDPVIYGEHFDETISPRHAGGKLFKRNLSDIAAMGGRPRAAVVALALDTAVSVAWLEAFYRGLAAVSRRYHVPVIGGDIARHRGGLVATLTLVGEANAGRALTRSGARARDWIYVTGRLGGSILGHHWRFSPRLPEGAWLAGRPEVRAMMDVSDGLAKDLEAITPQGSRPILRADAIPVSRSARTLAERTGRPALEHALSDGEDYELLFVLNARADRDAFEAAWRRAFTLRLTCLGRFETAGASETAPGILRLDDYHGYEHLR